MHFEHPFSRERPRCVTAARREIESPDLGLGEPWQSAKLPQTSHTFSAKDPLAGLPAANPDLVEDLRRRGLTTVGCARVAAREMHAMSAIRRTFHPLRRSYRCLRRDPDGSYEKSSSNATLCEGVAVHAVPSLLSTEYENPTSYVVTNVQLSSAPTVGAYAISMKFGPAHVVLYDKLITPL
jgi:hypothetical protein